MEKPLPRISVITPSYNQGIFLEETILSVINQQYTDLEYIIVDGGSTDDSVEIIKKYKEFLKYWNSEKDNGQSNAINKGIRMATGDIFCWLNSDDVLLPDTLNIVGEYFLRNPNILLITGNTLRIDPKSRILFNNHIMKQNSWFAKRGIFNMSQPAMFWRRELVQSIGYLDESYHALMDMEYLIRVFESGVKIGQIDKTLAAIRIHPNTKTSQGGDFWDQEREKLSIRYKGQYDSRNIKKFPFLLFFLAKTIKLKYFRDLFFSLAWKGRPLNEYIKSQKSFACKSTG